MDNFAHLHCHYDAGSILDGHATIKQMVARAAELGQPALAITDHGDIGGAKKFVDECNSNGVKPIVGCEFYVAPQSRTTKSPVRWGRPEQKSDDVSRGGAYTHITLLATTDEGVSNLLRIHASGYADGFYYEPRIDLDLLAAHNRGIVATTGCASGELAVRLRLGQETEAIQSVMTLRDIFGERLFVELMAHDNQFDILNADFISVAQSLGVKLLATNDSHYTYDEDKPAHDAILCISTGGKLADEKRFSLSGTGYHLRSREEMDRLGLPKEALDNTLLVAEMVEYRNAFSHHLRMPVYPSLHPDGSVAELREWCEQGRARLGMWNERAAAREEYELGVIIPMDFTDYHLIVADVARFAKREGIRVGPGRGSAGGSLVCYEIGIHDLDPFDHGLLFERYLNPDRISLPDIDMDIQDDRRDVVIRYMLEKYGDDFFCQIGTSNIIGAKSSIHDATRVLGHTRRTGDLLTYRLPDPKAGKQPKLAEGDWAGLNDTDQTIIDLAEKLEGRVRSKSIHAAGVVISPETLVGMIPLNKPKGKAELPWVTDYDMLDIEALGLVKMDWLGLNTLGTIDACMRMLREQGREPSLPTRVPELVDGPTFDLLSRGNTLGVFQLDGVGMQQLLRSLKPTEFGDVSAVLALYRPGPMGANAHHSYAKRKNGKERISYPHPELAEPLKEILADTYGVIVYQEQVMAIAQEVAGYSLGAADLLRRAMGKKKKEILDEEYVPFSEGMRGRGYSDAAIEALWDILVPFSDYAFNKAHTAGYGLVSWWTAYLKANFPNEWMSALLTGEGNPKKVPVYLSEVERMLIPVLPPDINSSKASWTPTPDGIRYGLASIKGFGKKTEALAKKRPYLNLDDFFRRADRTVLNAATLKVLVQAGALDSLCDSRSDLFLQCEALAERALSDRAERRKGQNSLFQTPYSITASGGDDTKQRQSWEKELLGTVLTRPAVTATTTRWLSENEFLYIKQLVDTHPGPQLLNLQVGYATIPVGRVRGEAKFYAQLEAIGGVSVDAPPWE